MREVRKAGGVRRMSRFLIPSALVSLVLAGAIIASPQVAPMNIEPPTITGTPRARRSSDRPERQLVEQTRPTFATGGCAAMPTATPACSWRQTAGRTGSLRPTLGARCASASLRSTLTERRMPVRNRQPSSSRTRHHSTTPLVRRSQAKLVWAGAHCQRRHLDGESGVLRGPVAALRRRHTDLCQASSARPAEPTACASLTSASGCAWKSSHAPTIARERQPRTQRQLSFRPHRSPTEGRASASSRSALREHASTCGYGDATTRLGTWRSSRPRRAPVVLLGQSALRHARAAEAVRCLHAKLAPGASGFRGPGTARSRFVRGTRPG